ncbi:MAG TPA: sodium ion-translocating decarboxylase subunit beta [Dehalococcoidia bacterium]|nr:sodium ion-translocating decarboxylase subunit beta [Dehalococcoidia bacterium]
MFGLFETGFANFTPQNGVMLAIGGLLLYLGIAKKMEPLLLVPIGFGVLLINLPLGGLMETIVEGRVVEAYAVGGEPAGLLSRIFYYGLVWEIVPAFIFLGLGAMTDFGPVIANPKTLLLGAGAQFGVYAAFFIALAIGFNINEAASIGIIGGADGPTTIFLTNRLAPALIGATAVSAYTYMAMVPIIQPPIIKALTTKKERAIYMKPQLRPVSRLEKVLFPIIGAIIIILLVPKSAPLIGMFTLGNLLKESGVTDRLANTAATAFIDILTILLGISVGAFMSAASFLKAETLMIFGLGIAAFAASTFFGVILAKFMNLFLKEKINPMIGAAGVSAVPMAARVVQRMGQQANPRNFLLMHAMGPNIAGVIGTATAAGIFLGMLG